MHFSKADLAGAGCAAAAVALIAWMCFRSWGGILPF